MQKAATAQYTEHAGSIGLSFFPVPDTVYEWAQEYGPEGRRAFIKTWLTYDFFWPLSFTTLYLVFIGITMRYVHGPKAARLCALAMVTLVMDYLENILAIIIMSRFPVRLEVVAWGLAGANALKWISMYVVSALFCLRPGSRAGLFCVQENQKELNITMRIDTHKAARISAQSLGGDEIAFIYRRECEPQTRRRIWSVSGIV